MSAAYQIGPVLDHLQVSARDALLVIDVQNDFCKGGALEVPGGDQVLAPINALMSAFDCVVLTQDWHPAGHSSFASEHPARQAFETVRMPYGEQVLWPDHCVQGTVGAQFHDTLVTDAAQLVIRKGFRQAIDSYSAFFENDRTTATGLAGYLRERDIDRVVCVGLALDFCVRYSAEDACRNGFRTVLIESACRGIHPDAPRDTRLALDAIGVHWIGA